MSRPHYHPPMYHDYMVHLEDDPNSSTSIAATSPAEAATLFVEYREKYTLDFAVASGADVAYVLVTDESGVVTSWEVGGCSTPTYWASPAGS